ncbi:MAG TPA: hypothetical protein VK045_00230, partial [Ornithinicoccus sp.]|nr:hypothetical protein [Ornithinicoccus sp.]
MLQSTWSRLLTIVLGWAMVVTLTGLTPGMAAGTPPLNGTSAAAPVGDAAAFLGAGLTAADPEDESGSAAEAGAALGADATADGELAGGVSLLDGLDVQVADIDPAAAGVAGEAGAAGSSQGPSGEADLEAALVRPDLTKVAAASQGLTDDGAPKIDPAVTEALETDEAGEVSVIIELTGSADLATVAARADSAGLEAAREVRESARDYGQETARKAGQAADAARGQVVVDTLRETGASERAALIADLGGAGKGAAAAPAGAPGNPVDLWMVNSVGATIDAATLD